MRSHRPPLPVSSKFWKSTEEDAYRGALRDLIDLEEDPTPAGAVLLRKTQADYRIYLYRALYRAVYRVSSGQRKVIVLRVGPRGGGIYRGYEKW